MDFEKIIFNLLENGMDLTDISDRFHSCLKNSDRIHNVLEMDKATNALQLQKAIHLHKQEVSKPQKSHQLSTSLRNEGNVLYQRQPSSNALGCYNNSIFVGEGESLALAYANRSAVLYDMGFWLHALRDIQLALDLGYPKHLEYKLRERQGNCWLQFNNNTQAFISFSLAKNLLVTSENSQPEKLAKILSKLKSLGPMKIRKMESMKLEDIEEKIIKTDDFRKPTPETSIQKTNHILPCASTSIKLVNLPDRGRGLVATKELRPGTTIIVEKAFVSILLKEFSITHCHYCLHWSPGPIPCQRCSQVTFCSTGCRDQAWASYHQHECGLTELLGRSNVNDTALLALRTVLKEDRQTLLKAAHGDGTHGKQVYNSDYETIHRLVGNTTLRSGADLFYRSVLAVYLINLVKGETDLELSTALLHLLLSYPCNAYGINESIVPPPSYPASVAHVKSGDIGVGIFSIISLLNHSCHHNVTRISYGDVMEIKVIRKIKCGEEILSNYGYHFASKTKKVREDKLEQLYQFECNCIACVENWPIGYSIPKLTNRSDLADAIKADFDQFNHRQSCHPAPGQMLKWAKKFEGYLNILDDNPSFRHPNVEYLKVQEALIECYKLMATIIPLYKPVLDSSLSQKLSQVQI